MPSKPDSRHTLERLAALERHVNALQTAVAQLKSDFDALWTVVAANTFTSDDVASVNTIDASVKALSATLAPPVPTETETTASR